MNLAKHDPETEMDMNMTPMIDVVFLLIIFFMIITDLTQQDLEELELPVARYATPDKPDPDDLRPIVNTLYDGTMIVRREPYYQPEVDDAKPNPFERLQNWLSIVADKMEKEPINEDDPNSAEVPGDPLLIRADQVTPFKFIQNIMQVCGKQGIQIWKVQLAAAESEEQKSERLKEQ